MSCVVGIVEDGDVYMGCDSVYVDGWTTDHTTSNKLFRRGEFLIGSTGSIRVRQLVTHVFNPPPIPDGMALEAYMVTLFVDALRECLKAGGRVHVDEGAEKGGNYLVAVRGRLFVIEGHYAVVEPTSRYWAIGCARDIVIGSLYTSAQMECPPEQRIRLALEAPAAHNMGVQGPFVYLSLNVG